jgi:transcription termination/antitermination protein NusA
VVACAGPRGSRVRMVVSELRGEKIDIIPFNEEPARFIAKALSPARVREVLVDDESKQATVVVPDDQLSLAIGREGLNARLAARLTGWRIDIRSETEFAAEEAEGGYEEEVATGRCAAILTSGRRCPNAALPGSRYCGLPARQALAETGSDYVGGEPPEGEIEGDDDLAGDVGELADEADADAVAESIDGRSEDATAEAEAVGAALADPADVDVDEASSAVEPGGAESESDRGLDDDVERAEADAEASEFEDEDIDSVDVERTAHDDVNEAAVTDDDLKGHGGEGQ